MARRPARERSESNGPAKTNREKIVGALMELLAGERIEDIGFGAIARRAGLSLAECRAEFRSVLAVVAAYTKDIDRQVLAGGDTDTEEEPLGDTGSRVGVRAQRPHGALDAMDADRGRHQRGRPQGHAARAGAGAALRLGDAHVARR
jgi:hypothetical protein